MKEYIKNFPKAFGYFLGFFVLLITDPKGLNDMVDFLGESIDEYTNFLYDKMIGKK